MSFEIVGNYQKHGYSLPTQAGNDLVPASGGTVFHYPRDVFMGQEWTNRTSSITLAYGSKDDSYSTTPLNIGFDWGWNGTTYTQWYLNTNGMMLFALGTVNEAIDASIDTTGIVAHQGDLYFDTAASTTYNGYYNAWLGLPSWYSVNPTPSSYWDYTVSNFSSHSIVCENYNGYVRFRYTGTADFNPVIELFGYIDTAGNYQPMQLSNPGASIDMTRYIAWGGNVSGYSGLGTLYRLTLKQYNDGIVTTIPWSSMSKIRVKYLGGPNVSQRNPTGVWDYNYSWVDNGVTHYYYSVVVYCTHYLDQNLEASYRISLYKAGASQRFSVSIAHDNVVRNYRYSSTGNKCGPWPFGVNSSLLTKSHWCEQSWYSENNGTTWYRYAPGGTTTYSTMTLMGPPQTNYKTSYATIQHILAKLDPASNNSAFYYGSTYNPINYYEYFNQPDFPSTFGYTIGLSVVTAMQNILVDPGPVTATETRIRGILNQSIVVGSGKNSVTYTVKDMNRDSLFDQNDVTELRSLVTGRSQVSDPDTYTMFNILLGLIVQDAYSDSGFLTAYINGGYLIHSSRYRWGYAWDNKWILPGVKLIPTAKTALSTRMYDGLGSVASNTIVPLNGTYIANQSSPQNSVWF